MYDNIDGNTSFQCRISQKDTINQINIRMTNQDNEEISTLDNWNLTLQLERHESILNQIKEYIIYIYSYRRIFDKTLKSHLIIIYIYIYHET